LLISILIKIQKAKKTVLKDVAIRKFIRYIKATSFNYSSAQLVCEQLARILTVYFIAPVLLL